MSSFAFKAPTWRQELGQEELAPAPATGGRAAREVGGGHFCGAGEVPAYPGRNTMVLPLSAAAAEVKRGGSLRHSSCSRSLFTQARRPV